MAKRGEAGRGRPLAITAAVKLTPAITAQIDALRDQLSETEDFGAVGLSRAAVVRLVLARGISAVRADYGIMEA